MKSAEEWVKENSENLCFDRVGTIMNARRLVREIQMDALSRNYGENALEPEKFGYPATWTNYLTVGELRARLADPLLMDGDLTNVTEVERECGPIWLALKTAGVVDEIYEE